MAIEMPIEARTADKIDFRSLLYAASTHSRSKAFFPFSDTTSASHRSREVEDAIKAYHALVPKRTIEGEEAEEREWDRIVHKPQVQQAFRRMAAEARRQYYAGETEEGGFGLE